MKRLVFLTLLLLPLLSLAQSAPVKLAISDGMINATNLSSQPIIVIELQVVGGVHGDNGNVVFHASHDFFFKVPLGPGMQWEVVHYLKENVPYTAQGKTLVVDADGKPVFDNGNLVLTPVTTRVVFIQYADGSTWGTPGIVVTNSMAKRKARWVAAHKWLAAYQTGGAVAFSSALANETTFPAEAAMIADRVTLGGADQAAQMLAAKLATADSLMATGKF